jgi:hypothetical protein
MAPIIGAVAGIVTTWLQGKQKQSEAAADRKAELIRQAGSWEEIHAEASKTSWKDEYWTIVFSIPLILVFFPSMVDPVMAGFAALDQTPEWYRYLVGALVTASIGIRQISKFKLGGK